MLKAFEYSANRLGVGLGGQRKRARFILRMVFVGSESGELKVGQDEARRREVALHRLIKELPDERLTLCDLLNPARILDRHQACRFAQDEIPDARLTLAASGRSARA